MDWLYWVIEEWLLWDIMDWLYRHRKADWTGYSGTRMLRGLVEDSELFILGQRRLVSVVILGYSGLVILGWGKWL